MDKKIALLLVVASVGLANALYGSKSDVVILTNANFNYEVVQSSDIWLVQFYAPWCGHCKSLAPEWHKAATALKGIVNVGAVDCDVNSATAGPYNVRGFPTIKIFGANKNSPQDYNGARDAKAIVDEAMKVVKELVSNRLSGRDRTGGGGGSSGGSGGGNSDDVVELTDANFEKLVLNSKDHWLVNFFAPWCGHCQRFEPEWQKSATELKGWVKFGALDATVHTVTASRFGVQGYPTLKYFPNGPKTESSAVDFNWSGMTATDIVAWGTDVAAGSLPAPEVIEITDESVIREQCDERPICVVSVLPHILDTGAEERNEYLAMLKDIGYQFKAKNLGWVWTAQGSQTRLQEALGMRGFGDPDFPAMAAVNSRKGVITILKGSFSSEGIRELLRAVSTGMTSAEPVEGGWPPTIVKAEPWDGKDGEMPEEEDFDLDDLEDFDLDDLTMDDLIDLIERENN